MKGYNAIIEYSTCKIAQAAPRRNRVLQQRANGSANRSLSRVTFSGTNAEAHHIAVLTADLAKAEESTESQQGLVMTGTAIAMR